MFVHTLIVSQPLQVFVRSLSFCFLEVGDVVVPLFKVLSEQLRLDFAIRKDSLVLVAIKIGPFLVSHDTKAEIVHPPPGCGLRDTRSTFLGGASFVVFVKHWFEGGVGVDVVMEHGDGEIALLRAEQKECQSKFKWLEW